MIGIDRGHLAGRVAVGSALAIMAAALNPKLAPGLAAKCVRTSGSPHAARSYFGGSFCSP